MEGPLRRPGIGRLLPGVPEGVSSIPALLAVFVFSSVLTLLPGCGTEASDSSRASASEGAPGSGTESTTVASSRGGGPAGAGGRMRVASLLGAGDTAGFERAVEPRPFTFPDDHGPHRGFRTEWWYVTGQLVTESGRRFGYQFTVFRTALAPDPPPGSSEWRTNQAYMAHFAVSDVDEERFLARERFARGALGLAGARARPFRVWLEDWWLGSAAPAEGGGSADPAFPMRLVADGGDFSVDLLLERGKPPVLQGDRGLSQKGPGVGNASYYYSLTRMPTDGQIVVAGDTLGVRGTSWLDREWSTSALGPGVEGWDWFALQIDGDRELMLYRLRREDGSASDLSRGVWVEPDGSARLLDADDVEARPTGWWESPEGGVRYPLAWELSVPSEELTVTVSPVLEDQEWRGAFRYWEGAVDVRGSLEGDPLGGRGYLELTGYE